VLYLNEKELNQFAEFKVPIKRHGNSIFMFGGGSIAIVFLFVMSVLESDNLLSNEAIGCIVAFPYFSMYAMWYIFGYEKVIFKNQKIELLKSNRVFNFRKIYSYSEVKSIQIVDKKLKSKNWVDVHKEWIKETFQVNFIFPKKGQLKLVTHKGEVSFFNGLSNKECQLMKEILETEIKKQKHNTT
jgi:hypothetical protein